MTRPISRAGQFSIWAAMAVQDMPLSPESRHHVAKSVRQLATDLALECVVPDERVQEIVQSYATHIARSLSTHAATLMLMSGRRTDRALLARLMEEADGRDDQ